LAPPVLYWQQFATSPASWRREYHHTNGRYAVAYLPGGDRSIIFCLLIGRFAVSAPFVCAIF